MSSLINLIINIYSIFFFTNYNKKYINILRNYMKSPSVILCKDKILKYSNDHIIFYENDKVYKQFTFNKFKASFKENQIDF